VEKEKVVSALQAIIKVEAECCSYNHSEVSLRIPVSVESATKIITTAF